MGNNNEYSITGNDIRAYALIRRGLVHENVAKQKGFTGQVSTVNGIVVSIDDGWVAYELGMLRLLQYAAKKDLRPINVISADYAIDHAEGRSVTTGRLVFRNSNVSTLGDLKRRLLTDDRFSVSISSEGFGIDFEEEITAENVNDAKKIENPEEISWAQMPAMDILLVASDERDIELPRVMRFKDVSIGDTGSSEGATDTEENEFCNFIALSGYTPFRTLRTRIYSNE